MRRIKNVILNVVKNLCNSTAFRWFADASLTLSMTRMAVLCSFLYLFVSCEHRPLQDPDLNSKGRFLRVYLNEHIRNVSFGFYDESKQKPDYQSPVLLRVVCAEPHTDKVITERYLQECGRDEKGYYIQGYIAAPEGVHNVMAFTCDVENVDFQYEYSFYSLVAHSEKLSDSEVTRIFHTRGEEALVDEPICRQPGHLFVATIDNVLFGWDVSNDTIFTEAEMHPVAETIAKTYYMQVNVKGVEYVKSAVALITGMSGAKSLYKNEMLADEPVSIYFGLNNGIDKSRIENETRVAYASFNTFGKLPDVEGYIEISFEFKTIYNTVQTETFRVTDLFDTPMVKDNQWIIIDKVIEIVPPEGETGGGLSPGVSDWEQIEGSITI